jgi:hypothetical protein
VLALCVTAALATLALHHATVFVGLVLAGFELVYIRRLDALVAVAHANARALIVGHRITLFLAVR